MKSIFDTVSRNSSKLVTKQYSTSFSLATRMLGKTIQQDIYNIYGFVRFADEIVDSFHDYNQTALFEDFEKELDKALTRKISLNPILNAFQETVHKYQIPKELYDAFMKSMRWDLSKSVYDNQKDYEAYIYGSADVVGLMCLLVFVKGDQEKYEALKNNAMKLGSAFQKVNFLRDLKADFENLNRSYFPNTDLTELDENSKQKIIQEIEQDFRDGLLGIRELPLQAKFGVYTAYIYYLKLLQKLKKTPSTQIKNTRIRVSNSQKAVLLCKSYINYKLKLI